MGQTDRQTDKQINRKIDKQTNRQTDKQANIQTFQLLDDGSPTGGHQENMIILVWIWISLNTSEILPVIGILLGDFQEHI